MSRAFWEQRNIYIDLFVDRQIVQRNAPTAKSCQRAYVLHIYVVAWSEKFVAVAIGLCSGKTIKLALKQFRSPSKYYGILWRSFFTTDTGPWPIEGGTNRFGKNNAISEIHLKKSIGAYVLK